MLNILVDAIMCQSSESHLASHQSLALSCSSVFPFISLAPLALVTVLPGPGRGDTQIEGEARRGAMYLCTYATKINIKAAFLNVYVHPSYVSTITIHYNDMIVSPRLAVITD